MNKLQLFLDKLYILSALRIFRCKDNFISEEQIKGLFKDPDLYYFRLKTMEDRGSAKFGTYGNLYGNSSYSISIPYNK